MLIAIAGLASSHPFTDARILEAAGAELVVCDDEPARLERFRGEHPGARVVPGLEEVLAARPDGVVLTVPTPRVPAALGRLLEHDRPCFVNKPAAATRAQLAELARVVERAPHRVLTTSVLRFAPAFTAFAAALDEPAVLAAHAVVRHDVGRWARGHNPWQDDPAEGGGMPVTMGVHGVELLVALLGPEVRLTGASAASRHYRTLRSADTALLGLRWGNGIAGSVTFLGATDAESYELILHTRVGTERVVVRGGIEELGYRATLEAFRSMVDGGPSPVPWPQTRAILEVLTEACGQFGS